MKNVEFEHIKDMQKMYDQCFLNALLLGTGFIKFTINDGFSVVSAEDYKYIPKEWMANKVDLENRDEQ